MVRHVPSYFEYWADNIEEADVFMAERDPGDIARNELVSSKSRVYLITPPINK